MHILKRQVFVPGLVAPDWHQPATDCNAMPGAQSDRRRPSLVLLYFSPALRFLIPSPSPKLGARLLPDGNPKMHDTVTAGPTSIPDSNAAEGDELVAFAECELIGINNAMMLVINRRNGNQLIMAPQVVEGLKTCSNFDTLAGHAAHLASTRPELNGNQAMAASVLENLKGAGMLLRAAEIRTSLAQPAPRQLPPTRVFIITCDRPAAVERLLESMLRNAQLSRHDALFLVDDSRVQANRDANSEAVARFNLRSPRELFYLGVQAQQQLMSGLVQALPAHTAGVHFLLDPGPWQGEKTYGRSRNLCLLMSVGYRALVMDDDILCQAVLPPLADTGVGIGSGGMRQAAFYGSEQALLAAGEPAGFDPLSGHASLLGSNLGHALQAANNGPLAATQLHQVNAALANVLTAESPVLVTQCGSLGDPGTGGVHWASNLGDDSVKRLLAAPMGMTAALEQRTCWLGSSRPNFFKMPFMSQLTGLDNSRLLPPYFPAFRGEDLLFGAMLVAMHHHSVSLEYPWSVPHLPLEQRRFNLTDPFASGGGIVLFARYLTEHIDYRDTTDPEHHLRSLAQDALRMAARTDAALLLDYRAELARGHADALYNMQAQYARTEQFGSAEWLAYLQRGIAELQQALAASQSVTGVAGVAENATEAELLGAFRKMALGFAAALAGWVEIRETASALASELIDSRKLLPR